MLNSSSPLLLYSTAIRYSKKKENNESMAFLLHRKEMSKLLRFPVQKKLHLGRDHTLKCIHPIEYIKTLQLLLDSKCPLTKSG